MHNEELLTALDNSPTYSRTAQELERITAIATTLQPVEEPVAEELTEQSEEEREDTL
jgi:hypothetical protein